MAGSVDVPVTKIVQIDGHGAFQLQYTRGEGPCGPNGEAPNRIIDVNFFCDPNAYPYDPTTLTCGEEHELCRYYLNIHTSLVCDMDLNLHQKDNITGWLFIGG